MRDSNSYWRDGLSLLYLSSSRHCDFYSPMGLFSAICCMTGRTPYLTPAAVSVLGCCRLKRIFFFTLHYEVISILRVMLITMSVQIIVQWSVPTSWNASRTDPWWSPIELATWPVWRLRRLAVVRPSLRGTSKRYRGNASTSPCTISLHLTSRFRSALYSIRGIYKSMCYHKPTSIYYNIYCGEIWNYN